MPEAPLVSTNPLLLLAAHAATVQPPRHAVRRAMVDWFACLVPGARNAPGTLMAAALAGERGAGRARCYIDNEVSGIRHAALLNAVASHTVEFDDIHRDSGHHPGSVTIAAALAAAQHHGASLETLHRAITAGYEVACRIGMAVTPSHYRNWHTTGTVGTMGAAAAVAVILGCDEQKIAHAIALSATMAGGLQQAFRGDGMSKPLHPGHAAEAGTLAAMSAAAGMTGALDVLHGPVGFAAATSDSTGRWDVALAGLDGTPLIDSITFKNHGCCGHIFPALDAVTTLRAEHGFGPDDVKRIHIGGYSATKDVTDRPDARTEQECRFSAQYCMGALLVLGGVRLAAFTPDNLVNPAIRAIMPRVSVSLSPDLASAYPRQRAARVEVELTDGRVLSHYQPTRKGDPDMPLTDEELSQKFRELVVPVVGQASAEALLNRLWHDDVLPD
ncbi:MmgE/PrpD family protein [Rhodovarius crocodyli]|uniref:MmgE/PrpD family protein n=2 Tax=Rhodovarius crocodyli TaxID=1979269 RepID=A0A437MPU7_9PROT|nr:MmgE/PrpD family protein [Rhodovarius crocodyli]